MQRGLVHRFSDLGADPAVAPDESRVLRLVPYPNRKRWPDGVPTKLLYQSECRYALTELAEAVAPEGGTAFSRNEDLTVVDAGGHEGTIPLDGEAMQHLVERAEGARFVFESWLKRNMRPGIHYGVIPVDGQDASKPTLLKPGAELVASLYGWRFHFAADLDSLSMYGPGAGGVFGYVCTVIDRDGRTVGQGRGMAELRETDMKNGNKAVKMAEKRAMVDAILRCAALSQWFTQDLEDAQSIGPPLEARAGHEQSPPSGQGLVRCTPAQVHYIRTWLTTTRRTEGEVLRHYRIERLEELTLRDADRLLQRLRELRRA